MANASDERGLLETSVASPAMARLLVHFVTHDPDEAEEQVDPLQLERAVVELMEAAHRALAAERPDIAGVLVPPSNQ